MIDASFQQQVRDAVDKPTRIHRMTCWYFTTKRALAQGLVEYGLIIALVALLAVASLLLFRPALPSLLSTLSTSV